MNNENNESEDFCFESFFNEKLKKSHTQSRMNKEKPDSYDVLYMLDRIKEQEKND